MSEIIPIQDIPSFIEEITFDDTPYLVEFNFNYFGDFWTISFYDREENLLVAGIVLKLNFNLLEQYPDRGLPEGELWVFDNTSNLSNPGRNDFEIERLHLVYYSLDEL